MVGTTGTEETMTGGRPGGGVPGITVIKVGIVMIRDALLPGRALLPVLQVDG